MAEPLRASIFILNDIWMRVIILAAELAYQCLHEQNAVYLPYISYVA